MTAIDLFKKHKYINVTTFRKNGEEVPTPVWFVVLEDKLYTFTGATSGKVKRIRANGRVKVAPSDVRGKPLAGFVPVHARFVEDEALQARVTALYIKKYGLAYRLMTWSSRLRGAPDETVFLEFSFEVPSE